MSDYTKSTTRKFRKWWHGIKKHSLDRQQDIISKWLFYACKTAALRGDQHQQLVVYTTKNRYNNSKYRRISRWQAERVWMIVNQKQENFKREQRTAKPVEKPNIVVIRKRNRRIITGGSGAHNS